MSVHSPEYFAQLEEMLRALLPQVQSAVDLETSQWYEEYLRAGEYGLAVEAVLEKIAAAAADPLPTVARRLVDAAERMGISSDAVSGVKQRLEQS